MTPHSEAATPPGSFAALLKINPFWWLLFIAALNIALPFLPISNLIVAVASNILLTLVYVGAVVLFALGIARREWSLPITLAAFVAGILIWLGVQFVLFPLVGGLPQSGFRDSPAQVLATTAQAASLLCAATFGGFSLARGIRSANMLGPIGGIIAVIDIWGVLFGGPISQIMASEAAAPVTKAAMTEGPKIGNAAAVGGFSIPMPAIGVGDFLFLAFLLGIIVIHRMNWRTPAWATWLLVSGALLSIVWLPVLGDVLRIPLLSQGFPLPGLLFIGAGAVLPNLKYFTYTRDERFALLWAGVLVLVMTVGIHFGLQRALAGLDDKPVQKALAR